jgi:hypothetical protein
MSTILVTPQEAADQPPIGKMLTAKHMPENPRRAGLFDEHRLWKS